MEFNMYKDKHIVSSCESFSIDCSADIGDVDKPEEWCSGSKIFLYQSKLGQTYTSTVFTQTPGVYRKKPRKCHCSM